MSLNLSERLAATASLINGGGVLVDVGTDHAYLPAYLILNNKIPFAIAADVRKMPLENAKETVKKYGLEEKIDLRLSDGLQNIKENEANEIVFAGMGGTLIAEKLKETLWIKNKKLHFVFQPQSRAEDLREFLFSNGFEIQKEIATHEGSRYYITFDAVYTGKINEFTVADCFIGKLPETEDAKIHLSKQLARLTARYEAKKFSEDNEDLFKTILKIKEFIND